MNLSRDNANDNDLKIRARENACAIINYHLGDINGKYRMLELLGEGVGAEYYSKNIIGLDSIDAIEYNKATYNKFSESNTNPKISLHCDSIVDYLHRIQAINETLGGQIPPIKYSILNMDFCQFYYPHSYTGKTHSGSENMLHLFYSKVFYVGSLIFVTFMVKGFQTHLHAQYSKDILRDANLICSDIIRLAARENVGIELYAPAGLQSIFLYNPAKRGPTEMMHACFEVKSM